jgi:hypothetical protein
LVIVKCLPSLALTFANAERNQIFYQKFTNMKNDSKPYGFFKKRYTSFTIILLLLVNYSHAQPSITSSSNSDFSINSCPNLGDLYSMNCDMMHHRPGDAHEGRLWAIAFHGLVGIGQVCSVYVQFDDVNISPSYSFSGYIPLPNGASNPDIVIGDVTGAGKGDNYLIGVVFEDGSGDVILHTYSVTGVGSNSPTINTSTTSNVNLSNVGGGDIADYPHIDLFGDKNNLVYAPLSPNPSPYPNPWESYNPLLAIYHEFAITWHLYNNGSNKDEIWACIGELANPGSPSFGPIDVVSGSDEGIFPDIAALTYHDAPSPPDNADQAFFITYHTPNAQDLMLAHWESISSSWGTSAVYGTYPVALETGTTSVAYPRIEAPALMQTGTNASRFGVVASVVPNGGSYAQIHAFAESMGNSISSQQVCTLSSTTNHYFPAITGTTSSSLFYTYAGYSAFGIGTHQYSFGYYSTYNNGGSNGDLYANFVDYYSSMLNTSTFREINNTGLSSAFSGSDYAQLAMATATNTGENILTAWYDDGNAILYKFGTATSFAYKNSGVAGSNTHGGYTVYPNPAKDVFAIEGAKDAAYHITDITGHFMTAGQLDVQNNTINTSNFAKGIYMLNLTENGHVQRLKFIKD